MSGNTPAHRLVAGALAMAITAVCVGMAGFAALERATTANDKLMTVAVAVVLVVGGHLLPALNRRSAWAKVLFTACVIATIYNHAHFFQGAAHRAGEHRAQAVAVTGHTLALQAEIDGITARPIATVAAELAKATAKDATTKAALTKCQSTTPSQCATAQALVVATVAKMQALQVESGQASHAADLRSQLAGAAAAHDAARAAVTADPVDAQIAAMTGLSTETVGTVAAVLQSLLLELMGAALWAVALPVAAASTQRVVAPVPVRDSDRAITGTAPTAKPIASTVSLPKSLALLPGVGVRWRRSIQRMVDGIHRLKVNTAHHLSAIVRYPKMPGCGTSPALN